MALIVILPLVVSLLFLFLTRLGACSVLSTNFADSITFLFQQIDAWNKLIPAGDMVIILILFSGIETSIAGFKFSQWILKLVRGGS